MAPQILKRLKQSLWIKDRSSSTSHGGYEPQIAERFVEVDDHNFGNEYWPTTHRDSSPQRPVTLLDLPRNSTRALTLTRFDVLPSVSDKLFPITRHDGNSSRQIVELGSSNRSTHVPLSHDLRDSYSADEEHVEDLDANVAARIAEDAPPPDRMLEYLDSPRDTHSVHSSNLEDDSTSISSGSSGRPMRSRRQLILLIDSDVSLEISDGRGGFISYEDYFATSKLKSQYATNVPRSGHYVSSPSKSVYVVPHGADAVIRDGYVQQPYRSSNGSASSRGEHQKLQRNHSRSFRNNRLVSYGYTKGGSRRVYI